MDEQTEGEKYIAGLPSKDVHGTGKTMRYYDNDKNLIYEKITPPNPKAQPRWNVYDNKSGDEGQASLIGDFLKHQSVDDAMKSIKGARISEAAAKRNEKYNSIPRHWTGEAKQIAKHIIDNTTYGINKYISSSQSSSKYLELHNGEKIRMADHDLPPGYVSADYDYRYGGNPKEFVEKNFIPKEE